MKPKEKQNKKQEQENLNRWMREFKVSSRYVDPEIEKKVELDDVIRYVRNLKSIGFNGNNFHNS